MSRPQWFSHDRHGLQALITNQVKTLLPSCGKQGLGHLD